MVRYDLVSPRPRKDGKTYWCKVGAAFPRDKGGFSLVFDALPLPDAEGRVMLLMTEYTEDDRPSQDRQERGQRREEPAPRGRSTRDLDDEIPF